MMYMRGNKKDYDDWAAGGANGWSYDEVLPYFVSLEDNKQIDMVDRRYHGVGGPVAVGQFPYHPPMAAAILKGGEELGMDM
jgi:choline dehydrogenase-like flavoprotein